MSFVVRTKPWSNDGEPVDQEVTDACLAERTAEGHEVFELRRAAVRAIWLIIRVRFLEGRESVQPARDEVMSPQPVERTLQARNVSSWRASGYGAPQPALSAARSTADPPR